VPLVPLDTLAQGGGVAQRDVVRGLDDAVGTAMVVTHDDNMKNLATSLIRGSGIKDPDALSNPAMAEARVFESDAGTWAGLARAKAFKAYKPKS
jgi:phosphohistidine phosphatase SixA